MFDFFVLFLVRYRAAYLIDNQVFLIIFYVLEASTGRVHA